MSMNQNCGSLETASYGPESSFQQKIRSEKNGGQLEENSFDSFPAFRLGDRKQKVNPFSVF
jgi:hypothetical protein